MQSPSAVKVSVKNVAPAGDYHDQEGASKSFPASPTSVGPHSAAQTTTDPLTDAGKPKVQIDSESRTALKTDSILRCFYKARFTLDSRLSRPVTAWAGSLMETFCRALLQSIRLTGPDRETGMAAMDEQPLPWTSCCHERAAAMDEQLPWTSSCHRRAAAMDKPPP